MLAALLWVHVLCTTAGYTGLIAANVYALFLARSGDAHVLRGGLSAWRRSARIFGPLLGIGMLLGFWLAASMRVSLLSGWLIVTYAVIVAALALQAGVMIPWQVRSNRTLETGVVPRLTPLTFVLVGLSAAYTAIVGLMLLRPAL
jgi:hypothetical protein